MNAPRRIFLDANASVPPIDQALEALRQPRRYTNPSSPHHSGRLARRELDDMRRNVARALGAKEKQVTFVSGASEANRWLVDAIVALAETRSEPVTVVTSPLEHASLQKPLAGAAQRGALRLQILDVDGDGQLRLDAEMLGGADVVAVTSAHNETGVLTPLDDIRRLAPDAILCTDAAQYWARCGAPLAEADFISTSAHKIGGLAGVGAMVVRERALALPSPWLGGGQEGGRRPGTEAVALIAAFAAAASLIDASVAAHASLAALRDAFEAKVCSALPNVTVVGKDQKRLPNTSAIVIHGADGEALRMALDGAGLDVGFGSACSALAPEPSLALLAMGLTPADARATVRISLGPGANDVDVADAAARFVDVIRRVRRT